MIRVRQRVSVTPDFDYYRINRVCLPAIDIANDKPEDALLSSFGYVDENATKQAYVMRKGRYVIQTPRECKRRLNITHIPDQYWEQYSNYQDFNDTICAFTDKQNNSVCPVIIIQQMSINFVLNFNVLVQ